MHKSDYLNNILPKEKLIFWKGLTTDKALHKFSHKILCTLSDKMHVDGILCDLNKAFDYVNYELLSKQLLWNSRYKWTTF
jgi:hypothetical protein